MPASASLSLTWTTSLSVAPPEKASKLFVWFLSIVAVKLPSTCKASTFVILRFLKSLFAVTFIVSASKVEPSMMVSATCASPAKV